MSKPTTVKKAFENGEQCRKEGHSIHYNPYRNMGVESSNLNSAWIDGWEKEDGAIKNV
jgi:ribosome modulation factor